jgi:tripartite-type tricarboxylate transporter receptor subunit TctC
MRSFNRLACGFVLCALAGVAMGQSYPTKPVRLVNGFPAGGPADIFSRAIGQKFAELSGQPVIVENRAGAGGLIAAENIAKSPADGYSVFLANSGVLAFYQHLYTKLTVDTVKELAPVTLAVGVPEILVVPPALPVKTLKERAALARARPGAFNYASTGAGGITHLAVEAFAMAANVQMVHVPYKGAAPVVTDLLGGQIGLASLDIPVVLPHLQAGKLRGLAIASDKRSPVLPNLMTTAEAGYPQVQADNWYGVMVPIATPKPIVARLNELMVKSLQAPETRERFAALGANALGSTPEELQTFWRAEAERWGKAIRAVGLKLD